MRLNLQVPRLRSCIRTVKEACYDGGSIFWPTIVYVAHLRRRIPTAVPNNSSQPSHQPIKAINQSNQSTNKAINQPTNQSIKQAINQAINQSIDQSHSMERQASPPHHHNLEPPPCRTDRHVTTDCEQRRDPRPLRNHMG